MIGIAKKLKNPIVKQVLAAQWKYFVFSLFGSFRLCPICRSASTPPVSSMT